MRAVNLIPADQRRNARAEGGGGPSAPLGVRVLLGGLAAAVVAVLAVVLVSNQVNAKKDELVRVSEKQQAAQTASDALRPYGDFVKLQEDRIATVTALENSRFNWERVVRQLSHVIAPGVWIDSLRGTVSSESGGGGAGGASGGVRGAVPGPAIEIKGCSPSQDTVARMMSRMRDIDGAKEVVVSRSEQISAEGGGGGAATGDSSSAGAQQGCPRRYYEFEILVSIEGPSNTAAAAAGSGATAAAVAQGAAPAGGATGASGSTGATGGASQ